MKNYKLIIEYYEKGNKQEQIATLCSCSRMTVFTVLKRFRTLKLNYNDVKSMSEKEISSLIFPERVKAGEGYLIPDFEWEEFQMCKHQSSIRLCWRRYCKRAAKQNLMAYSWKCFITLYNAYRKPKIVVDDPNDKIRNKLKNFNFLLSCCPRGSINYEVIKIQKEEWLKSLKLEEDKILDDE
ncbi:MAG: helix-turn-helix domain-containing protein [Christensenellaceae bacterium]